MPVCVYHLYTYGAVPLRKSVTLERILPALRRWMSYTGSFGGNHQMSQGIQVDKWVMHCGDGGKFNEIHPNMTELFSFSLGRTRRSIQKKAPIGAAGPSHLTSKRCQGLESVCQQQPMIVHITSISIHIYSSKSLFGYWMM